MISNNEFIEFVNENLLSSFVLIRVYPRNSMMIHKNNRDCKC